MISFLDSAGKTLQIPAPSQYASYAQWIRLAAAKTTLGTATTDSMGNFQFSLSSLGTSQVILEASYDGDAQHWPAYARVAP